MKLPAFTPIVAHCRINDCDSNDAKLDIFYDALFENDVDSLHREDIVIFTKKQWDAIKAQEPSA